MDIYDLVLNGCNEPIIDLGLAHLYGKHNGFDLYGDLPPSHAHLRDPTYFVHQDGQRLRHKYKRLTGLDFETILAEDQEKMKMEKVELSEVRQKVGRSVCRSVGR